MKDVTKIYSHAARTLTFEQMRDDLRSEFSFGKTYGYVGLAIDGFHRRLSTARREDGMVDLGIPGWLLPANALKLYELAYFCPGDVLELGTYHGLSTKIIIEACRNSGRPCEIITVDHDGHVMDCAKANLERELVASVPVHFFVADAEQVVRTLVAAERRFELVFVDHSHAEDSVAAVAGLAGDLVKPGGFLLFNDFNDPRNVDPNNPDYGVFQGVTDNLDPDKFAFHGVFGSAGLFRRLS